MCAALSDERADPLVLDVHVDEETGVSPLSAVEHLADVIVSVGHRANGTLETRIGPIDEPPAVWDGAAWENALADHRAREGLNGIRLTIFWVQGLPNEVTGALIEPGVIAVDAAAIADKSVATGQPFDGEGGGSHDGRGRIRTGDSWLRRPGPYPG